MADSEGFKGIDGRWRGFRGSDGRQRGLQKQRRQTTRASEAATADDKGFRVSDEDEDSIALLEADPGVCLETHGRWANVSA
ncbi:hypothetical protein Scep_029957 [Stephania cephalantha]|uniref:Uncharacterized protein n=1 Tax=Stephania cephalantha TaxID=152367 RepID=A0AAP0DYR1_9MAGN